MIRWQERWQPSSMPRAESPALSDFQRWVIAIMCEHKESIKLAQLIGHMESACDPGAFKAKRRLSDQTVNLAERLHALESIARENGFDALFNPSERSSPVPVFPTEAFTK